MAPVADTIRLAVLHAFGWLLPAALLAWLCAVLCARGLGPLAAARRAAAALPPAGRAALCALLALCLARGATKSGGPPAPLRSPRPAGAVSPEDVARGWRAAANVSALSGEIASNGFTSTLQARIAALVKDEADDEDRVVLQTNIWRIVFGRQTPMFSTNYVEQVKNLSETAAFLTSFRACTQNDACLEILSMHLGRMTELSTKEHDRLCRAAYDRDQALQDAPYTRSAGSRGRMGPNMKAWRAKRARLQTWNRLVGEYRRDILSLMAANMRAFVAGLDVPRRAQFKRMFISRAKLTEEESDALFGKDDR